MFVYKPNLENQGLLKFRFCFDLCWWQLRFFLSMTNIKVWIFTNGHKTMTYREFIEFMFNVYKICSKSTRCNTLVVFQNCSSSILKFSLIDSLHLSYPKLLFRGRGGPDRYCTDSYLYNQRLSPLMLWVPILLMARCTRYNIMC